MKKLTLLSLVAMLVYGNCVFEKKVVLPDETAVMPPFSLNGANKMGCYLDNIIWANGGVNPTGLNNITTTFRFSKQKDSTVFNISGNLYTYKNDDNFSLGFSGKGIPKVGETYTLGKNADIRIEYQRKNDVSKYVIFKDKNPELNTIIFTKVDTLNKILSGRFDAKIFNSITKDSPIKVSDGRFDVQYLKFPE
jgi:hypothetical protein